MLKRRRFHAQRRHATMAVGQLAHGSGVVGCSRPQRWCFFLAVASTRPAQRVHHDHSRGGLRGVGWSPCLRCRTSPAWRGGRAQPGVPAGAYRRCACRTIWRACRQVRTGAHACAAQLGALALCRAGLTGRNSMVPLPPLDTLPVSLSPAGAILGGRHRGRSCTREVPFPSRLTHKAPCPGGHTSKAWACAAGLPPAPPRPRGTSPPLHSTRPRKAARCAYCAAGTREMERVQRQNR